MSEILITHDLMVMIGQPLINEPLSHQMASHMPSLPQRTLGIHTTQQPKRLRRSKSGTKPTSFSHVAGQITRLQQTFCSFS